MTDVDWVVMPERDDSLATVHGRYAQAWEAATNAAGTCGRTVCFPALAEGHPWTALRWVEQNPVRALLAASPEEYPWSSARAHLTGEAEMPQVLDRQFWETSGGSERWQQMHWASEDARITHLLLGPDRVPIRP